MTTYLVTETSRTQTPPLERLSPGLFRCGRQQVERGLSEELLACAYLRFRKENLLPVIFYERLLGITEFIQYFSSDRAATLSCWRLPEDGKPPELDGLLWFSDFVKLGEKVKLDCSIGMFRGVGLHATERYAQMGIYWVMQTFNCAVLTGATPAANRPAVLFGQRLGFEQFGPVPQATIFGGELCGVVVQAMTPQHWAEISPWPEGI